MITSLGNYSHEAKVSFNSANLSYVRNVSLYRGRDSNSHAIKHRFLRPACLPIPPPGYLFLVCQRTFNSYYDVNIQTIFCNSNHFKKKNSFRIILIGTSGRIRTLNNSFGDHYDTISPHSRI